MLNLDLNPHLKFEVLTILYSGKEEKRNCDYIYIIDSREANEEKIVLVCGGEKINDSNLLELTGCKG